MGYIEVRRKRDADPNELVIRAHVADKDIDRIYAAYSAIHFANGVGPTNRAPTQQEVMQAIADSFVQIMISTTLSREKERQAASLIPPSPIEVVR